MHQALKRKRGLIDAQSEYCPLDLFSRDRPRMIAALRALLRHPQNNLKIAFAAGGEYSAQTVAAANDGPDGLPCLQRMMCAAGNVCGVDGS